MDPTEVEHPQARKTTYVGTKAFGSCSWPPRFAGEPSLAASSPIPPKRLPPSREGNGSATPAWTVAFHPW